MFAAVACLVLAADPTPAEALSATLRTMALEKLPTPLTEGRRNWGHQKEARGRVIRRLEGRLLNDGLWQSIRIDPIDAPKTLAVAVGDLVHPAPGQTSFDLYCGLDTRLALEQQVWKLGLRLYGGETRARCRAALKLHVETTHRLEVPKGGLLPDLVATVKVTSADLNYTNLVVEHTLGQDGPAAAKLGELAHTVVTATKPDLERKLLDQANAAIVKAAGERQVRLALNKLLAAPSPTR
jgi:hypothetical protein